MYLARELTDGTLPSIGREFGNRNHTTVLHAHRTTAGAHRRRRRGARAIVCRPHRTRSESTAVTTGALTDLCTSAHPLVCTASPQRAPISFGSNFLTAPTTTDLLKGGHREALNLARRAADGSSDRHACGFHPQRHPGALRRQARGLRRSASSSGPPTWRWGCAFPCRPRSPNRAARVLPGRLLLDVVRSLPADAVTLELRAAEHDVEIVSGSATLPHPRAAHRGLPAPARARRGDHRPRAGAGVRRHGRPGRPLGLARRDAPGPDRHPRLGVRARAADGRHRLLSPER